MTLYRQYIFIQRLHFPKACLCADQLQTVKDFCIWNFGFQGSEPLGVFAWTVLCSNKKEQFWWNSPSDLRLLVVSNMCGWAQLCLALCDPMDCSPPDSSVHGIFWQEYWSERPFHPLRDFLTRGSNPCLLHWQVDPLALYHQPHKAIQTKLSKQLA